MTQPKAPRPVVQGRRVAAALLALSALVVLGVIMWGVSLAI